MVHAFIAVNAPVAFFTLYVIFQNLNLQVENQTSL